MGADAATTWAALVDVVGGAPRGWVFLRERPGEEIALGRTGRFWRPKTVCALSVRPLDERTSMLSAVIRTAIAEERAPKRFRRYRTLGPAPRTHALAGDIIDAAREEAERRARSVT